MGSAGGGGFKFTYLWQPINRYSFRVPGIRSWVEQHCLSKDLLNLVAGPTRLKGCVETSNDLDPSFAVNYQMDALDVALLLSTSDMGNKKFD